MNKIINYYTNNGISCDLSNCDYIQLELLGPHAKAENAIVLVSKSSLNLILQFQWYLGKGNYPITHGTDDKSIVFGKGVKMHKLLFPNLSQGLVIDHINRNRLDNRIENLRICTRKQNSYNTSKRNKDNYKGVYKQTNNLWTAKASKDGKIYEIKDIGDEKQAAQVYDMIAEVNVFGYNQQLSYVI